MGAQQRRVSQYQRTVKRPEEPVPGTVNRYSNEPRYRLAKEMTDRESSVLNQVGYFRRESSIGAVVALLTTKLIICEGLNYIAEKRSNFGELKKYAEDVDILKNRCCGRSLFPDPRVRPLAQRLF